MDYLIHQENEVALTGLDTYFQKNTEELEKELYNSWRFNKLKRFFIGKFQKRESQEGKEYFVFDDVRKDNFEPLGKYPIPVNLPIEVYCSCTRDFEEGGYYRFYWEIASLEVRRENNNPYQIVINRTQPIEKVEPEWFVKVLYDDIFDTSSRGIKMVKGSVNTIKMELNKRPETFIYELLQNANDYPHQVNESSETVIVEFHILGNYLVFRHSGEYFNLQNVAGICGINAGDKRLNKKAIGYKGIGFKTVFCENDYVYIKSGAFSFRFDEKAMKSENDPWEVMPIWTRESELEETLLPVLKKEENLFRAQFALRCRRDSKYQAETYERMFREEFRDSEILLFIPNVTAVSLFLEDRKVLTCTKNPEDWEFCTYKIPVSEKNRLWLNEQIDRKRDNVPEKFRNMETAQVSFALRKVKGELITVPGARIYSYLPTKITLGFQFLINSDFIPDGSRDGLHAIRWNYELMRMIGQQFFDWMQSLLSSSIYPYVSVFRVFPDFADCRNRHGELSSFIVAFQQGFEENLLSREIVPVILGKEVVLKPLNEIVYDETGWSESGMLSDEEFFDFTGLQGHLPHPELRSAAVWKTFVRTYLTDKSRFFRKKHFPVLLKNPAFVSWLEEEEHVIRFLEYLLDHTYLDLFKDQVIFPDQDGTFHKASDLYYNIDPFLEDLVVFEDQLPYLSRKLRLILQKNPVWRKWADEYFKKFTPAAFVRQLFEQDKEMVFRVLSDEINSVRFIHFLALNNVRNPKVKELPFYDPDHRKVDGYNRLVFWHSEEGNRFKSRSWVGKTWLEFISPAYLKRDQEKVKTYLEEVMLVKIFSDSEVLRSIILEKNYRNELIGLLNKEEENLDFYDFLSAISAPVLQHQKVSYFPVLTDGVDHTEMIMPEEVIFFGDPKFWKLTENTWIPMGKVHALSERYWNKENETKRKDFFRKCIGVYDFQISAFYEQLVEPCLNSIFESINSLEVSKEFLSFLYTNRKELLGKNLPDDLTEMPLFYRDRQNKSVRNKCHGTNCYFYNPELIRLLEMPWMPHRKVMVLEKGYLTMFPTREEALSFMEKWGIRRFDLLSFIKEELLATPDDVFASIREFENNLSFHLYFDSIKDKLSGEVFEILKNAPLFLFGNDGPKKNVDDTSTDHYLFSSDLQDILKLDCISDELLDTVHPDYVSRGVSETYLLDYLKNVSFSISDFIDYLGRNSGIQNSYLQEVPERNIRFWQWIKQFSASVEDWQMLSGFLVLTSSDTRGEVVYAVAAECYLSGTYVQDSGFEDFVLRYHTDAVFLSDQYADNGDNREEWTAFFKLLGVKADLKEVVFEHLIPELRELQDVTVVDILSKYLDDIKQMAKKNEDFVEQLCYLQVKCVSGEFAKMSEIVWIHTPDEAFPDIEIENTVSQEYFVGKTAKQIRAVKTFLYAMAQWAEAEIVDSLSVLRERKIGCLLEEQEKYQESAVHLRIFKELCEWNTVDQAKVQAIDGIEELMLYTSEGEYSYLDELVLGSLYKPECDFQKYGITNLEYISDIYAEAAGADEVKRLVVGLGVREIFEEEHLSCLGNYPFSFFFWKNYVSRHKKNLQRVLIQEKLEKLPCIPVNGKVAEPCRLYHPDLRKYVENLPGSSDLLPEVTFPEWLEEIGLKKMLDFRHGLEYLLRKESGEKRFRVMGWLLEQAEGADYSKEIRVFREYAKWKNGLKKLAPLKDLVALDPADTEILSVFRSKAAVVYDKSLPENKEEYRKICNLLGIPFLTAGQFREVPCVLDDRPDINKFLWFRLLIVAFWEGEKDWEKRFLDYENRLSELVFYECSSISLAYNEKLQDNYIRFYRNGNHFWFVDDWQSKRVYQDFVHGVREILGISMDLRGLQDVFDEEVRLKELLDGRGVAYPEVFRKKFPADLEIKAESETDDEDDESIPEVSLIPSEREELLEDEFAGETGENDQEEPDGQNRFVPREIPKVPVRAHERGYPYGGGGNFVTGNGHSDQRGANPETSYIDAEVIRNRKRREQESVTAWKEGNGGIFLSVKEVEEAEIEAVRNITGESISPEEMTDQHLITRLRLYNNLKSRGEKPVLSVKEFLNTDEQKSIAVSNDTRKIIPRSAKNGILYVSPFLWSGLKKGECRLCIYYGSKASEFLLINSLEELVRLIKNDNLVLLLKGKDKEKVIDVVFEESAMKAQSVYAMIRIKSNARYNGSFEAVLNSDAENNVDF